MRAACGSGWRSPPTLCRVRSARSRWRGRSGAHLAALDGALRAVFLGAIPILAAAGALSIGRYVLLLALSALLSAWGSAGRYTLVAQVLPSDLHLPANALLTVIAEASTVAGPVLAGLLIAFVGAPAVLAVDAATFAVLALSFALVRAKAPIDGKESRAVGVVALLVHVRVRAGPWCFRPPRPARCDTNKGGGCTHGGRRSPRRCPRSARRADRPAGDGRRSCRSR